MLAADRRFGVSATRRSGETSYPGRRVCPPAGELGGAATPGYPRRFRIPTWPGSFNGSPCESPGVGASDESGARRCWTAWESSPVTSPSRSTGTPPGRTSPGPAVRRRRGRQATTLHSWMFDHARGPPVRAGRDHGCRRVHHGPQHVQSRTGRMGPRAGRDGGARSRRITRPVVRAHAPRSEPPRDGGRHDVPLRHRRDPEEALPAPGRRRATGTSPSPAAPRRSTSSSPLARSTSCGSTFRRWCSTSATCGCSTASGRSHCRPPRRVGRPRSPTWSSGADDPVEVDRSARRRSAWNPAILHARRRGIRGAMIRTPDLRLGAPGEQRSMAGLPTLFGRIERRLKAFVDTLRGAT